MKTIVSVHLFVPVAAKCMHRELKMIYNEIFNFYRFLELDEGETVDSITQHDIAEAVDIASAQKVNTQFLFLVGKRSS